MARCVNCKNILKENKQKFSRRKKPEGIFPTLMESLEEMTKTMDRTISALENLDARLKVLEVANDRRSK